ncbi:hypothetical protein [Listeria booriae]|uniref:Uncharacterized protein n=1 Tax=Listeria booriae TaxID=1552123 RepID=A0A7X0WEM0_9LIST|nr:hypothetical protein [Listeria booriae]MBC1272174.1 hypothetical protein [Listeria booriae]MBC1287382.1 hypothetical protein [Listeria booriae]MBC1331139.1 hypothetical protein [Listeria booriae]MBC2386449.1 hypothetical protein [Listeria booriae]
MKDSEFIFPTIVETFLKEGIAALRESEAEEVQRFLERSYIERPCNEQVVYALVKFYNAVTDFASAKEVGQSFLMMDGYNKEVLGELSATFLQLDDMETYFSLVKQQLEKESLLEEPEQEVATPNNVVQFPKKIVPRRNAAQFSEWSTPEQLEFLQQARFHDVEPYILPFKAFLADATTSPFVKSMIFELLQEKRVDAMFVVRKAGMDDMFNPSKIPMLSQDDFTAQLSDALTRRFEHSNPSFLEQLLVIVQQHLFIMYPFAFPSEDITLWSEAYSKWLSQLYGNEWQDNTDVNPEQLIEAMQFIERMEQVQQNYLL